MAHITRGPVSRRQERLATCGIVDLEVLYSARNAEAYQDTKVALRQLPRVSITEGVIDRALEVQGSFAERSMHRSVSLPDLIIAACAELSGLTVLHYDGDFERIGEVTGQSVAWVVPRGSSD